jgi:hypothetical protein
MFELRDYQRDCLNAIQKALDKGYRRQLVALPTATGKTITFAHLVKQTGVRAIVFAHTLELVHQTRDKLRMVMPQARVGVLTGETKTDLDADILVATIQTACKAETLAKLRAAEYKLVIADEAHHFAADGCKRVVEGLTPELLVGFSATPFRQDGRGLREIFDVISFQRSTATMVRAGWLARPVGYKIAKEIDLKGVACNLGDYQHEALDAYMNTPEMTKAVVVSSLEKIGNRPTIVFGVSRAHAFALSQELVKNGLRSEFISGAMNQETRTAILARFRAGDTQILTNAQLLTEGWDAPWVSCVLIAKPTKSRGAYCLDSETEILTREGWRGIGNISVGDTIAAFDNGEIKWQPALAYLERPLYEDEKMFELKSPRMDIRVSGQHRMIFKAHHQKTPEWRCETAEWLASYKANYKLPVSGVEKHKPFAIKDHELALLGWLLTDGCLNRCNNQISISQSEHHTECVEDIKRCLDLCGLRYGVSSSFGNGFTGQKSPILRFSVCKGNSINNAPGIGWKSLDIREIIESIGSEKNFPKQFEDLDERQLGILLEAMHKGNGSKQVGFSWTRRSYHISHPNRRLVDALQSLCVRRGWACNIAIQKQNGNELYIFHAKKQKERWVGGAGCEDRQYLKESTVVLDERVWCVTVESDVIVTRRNGKVVIINNCQMVGRGLRLWPNKADCIVIDCNEKNHDICDVALLMGDRQVVGKKTDELDIEALDTDEEPAVKEYEPPKALNPGLKTVLKAFALLKGQFTWEKDSLGRDYIKGLGANVLLRTREDGLFDVDVVKSDRSATIEAEGLTHEYAFGVAEDWARLHKKYFILVDTEAEWRQSPISDAQKECLRKRGYTSGVDQLSKGEASVLMEHLNKLPRKERPLWLQEKIARQKMK